MTSRNGIPLKFLCAGYLALVAAPSLAEQATAVLMSGRSITGDVISETDKDIQIRTLYGDLTFRKMDLKELQRGGKFGGSAGGDAFANPSPGGPTGMGAPAGGFGGDPFGGGAASSPFGGAAAASPFGGSSAPADPFGGAPAAGGFGNSAPPDPFGGSAAPDPFGGTPSSNPFGGAATSNPFGGAPAASPFGGPPAASPFGGSTAPPDPFGGGAAPADPFGSAASADPFGGAASSSPFGGAASSNPFGGAPASTPLGGAPAGDPFGGSAGSDPFGGSTVASSFGAPAAVAVPPSAPDSGSYDPFAATNEKIDYVSLAAPSAQPAPPVPFSWDAVMYGLREGSTATVVAQPGAPEAPVSEPANLRNGAIVDTDVLPVRIVFKNGRDVARVAPISRIRVVESTPESIVVALERGGLWFDLAADGGSRKVVVRTNTAEIRAEGGGSFRVADALDHGVHLVVIEGKVEVVSASAQMAVRMEANKMLLVRPDGAMTQQAPLNKVVAQEYNSWDTLAADWWEDMRTMIAETNPVRGSKAITVSGLQGYLKQVSKAFGDFAQDTGHIPSDAEGFSVLAQNSGNWERWRGPYWTGILPPVDCWGRPMRYRLRPAGTGGRAVGIVYSLGPDQYDNEGDPAADVSELVLYYQFGL